MNYRCYTPLLSSEFSLTIALVVFVMITLFLVTIIVLLCISKSFRAFFFREHKDSNAEPLPPKPAVQAEPEPEAAKSEPKRPKRRKRSDPFGVPTVPLTFQAAEPEVKKSRTKKSAASSTDNIQTVEIDAIAPQSDKTTFITRTAPKKPDKRR